MKKVLIASVVAVTMLASCLKENTKCPFNDSTKVAPDQEIADLKDSLAAHGITDAIQAPSGFFYKIVTQGTGRGVTNLCSNITANYKGTFFNGKVFDSTSTQPIYIPLGQVIIGWQKGIPLVNVGGEINLYIPPSLGYGEVDIKNQEGEIIVPKHSFLVFNTKILNIQ